MSPSNTLFRIGREVKWSFPCL